MLKRQTLCVFVLRRRKSIALWLITQYSVNVRLSKLQEIPRIVNSVPSCSPFHQESKKYT